jgi:replicative DNA helicase
MGSESAQPVGIAREMNVLAIAIPVLTFIHRESYYSCDREGDPEDKNKAEIIIAKQRNGMTGTVDLAFPSQYTKFENLDTVHGDQ